MFNKRVLNEYLKKLKKLTINIFKKDFLKIENKLKNLIINLQTIENKKISPVQKIFFLTKIIKDYGTLPLLEWQEWLQVKSLFF